MTVNVYDPFVEESALTKLGVNKVELDKIIVESDYISPHVPLTDKTKNMLSSKEFDLMKDGVKIINVARGGVINEKALLEAINNGKVSAAALDVYESEPATNKELVTNEHVIATPHLGASSHEAQVNVAVEIAEQVVLALKENTIKNCVNNVSELK